MSQRLLPLLLAGALCAKSALIPRLSVRELTDQSDLIAEGRINRSWTAWDEKHKYIWTHYELAVRSVHKGSAGAVVEFAEPGGSLDGVAVSVPGAVTYLPGETVYIFLQKMPNGYLRTTGWGQGKSK